MAQSRQEKQSCSKWAVLALGRACSGLLVCHFMPERPSGTNPLLSCTKEGERVICICQIKIKAGQNSEFIQHAFLIELGLRFFFFFFPILFTFYLFIYFHNFPRAGHGEVTTFVSKCKNCHHIYSTYQQLGFTQQLGLQGSMGSTGTWQPPEVAFQGPLLWQSRLIETVVIVRTLLQPLISAHKHLFIYLLCYQTNGSFPLELIR